MTSVTVVPAYGRDYKSEAEAREAWESGKDFVLCDAVSPYKGRYCSTRDFPKGSAITIRYGRDVRRVVIIKQGE